MPSTTSLAEERVRALELMEMQRHTQLMYTSCGWFFDDISGIETVQIIAYAARVLQLAQAVFGDAGRRPRTRLPEASCRGQIQRPDAGDGAQIYKEKIVPLRARPRTGGGALCHQLHLLLVRRRD